MMRFALMALALVACTASLPEPRQPLVASDYARRPAPPPVAPVPPPVFPRVSERKRPGGTLWYVSDAAHDGLVVSVETRRGEDGAHPHGLASMTTGLMEEALEEALGEHRVSASTSIYGLGFEVRTTANELDATLAALARVLDGPPPAAEKVNETRDRLLERIDESGDNSLLGARQAAIDQLHGRPSHLGKGVTHWRSIVEGFTPEKVAECHRERFAPSDRLIVVTGTFEVAELRESFDRHFGTERPDPPRRPADPAATVVPRNAALSRPTRANQAYVVFARPAPPLGAPDRLAYELVVDLLGGTFSSRLMGSLRETHSYTYGTHAQLSAGDGSDLLFIEAAFHPPDVEGALEDLFEQLRSVRELSFRAHEIRNARHRLWARTQAALEGAGLANVLSRAWVMRTVPAALERRYRALADLEPETLAEVVRRRFNPHEGILVIFGDFHEVGGFTVERNESGFHLRE